MHRILTLLVLLLTAGGAFAQGTSSSTSPSANALLNDYKVNVVAASTGSVNLPSITPGVTAVDGVVLTAGARFLAKDQTPTSNNGIYTCPSALGAAVRATDANAWNELPGAQVTAAGGTTNKGKIYVCTAAATGTLGSTAIPWAEIGTGGAGSAALQYALSDEDTDLTLGLKMTVRVPYTCTLVGLRSSCTLFPSGAAIKTDVRLAGTSILTTQSSIDDGTRTSVGSAAPAVILTSALPDDGELTFYVMQTGTTQIGKGLKLTLYVTR